MYRRPQEKRTPEMSTKSFKEAKAKIQKIIKEELFYRDFYRASDITALHDKLKKAKQKGEDDETNQK